ncbi:MAG: hypothetical protein H0X29_05410 [Parachlamydiaceae bacterium]|nr:hypothetical protein [Parachlamydiaceae bacterium]
MRLPVGFSEFGGFGYGYATTSVTCDEIIDISSLESAFSKNDLSEIIESPNLFWLAFCKAYNDVERKCLKINKNRDAFSVSIHGKMLHIAGLEHIIADIQQFIEELRTLFIKGHIKIGGFKILSIKLATDYFLKAETEIVDLSNWIENKDIKLYQTWFEEFIQPTLPNLFNSLGAKCSESLISQKILTPDYACRDEVKAFEFNWENGDLFVYPIKVSV